MPEGPPGRPLLLVLCAALFVASRLPLLGLGFGSDADVWGVAANSRLLAAGHYVPSRLPGHPLHEVLFALAIAVGGPLATNILNLALALAVIGLTWRLAGAFQISAPLATVALLALHPLFWIASADGTDFMLATVLALAALSAALGGRAVLAGVLLGLAAASRIEAAAFALPIWWLLPHHRPRMGLTASLVAACAFAPAVAFYLHQSASIGDLVTARLSPRQRVLAWLAGGWAALGLVPTVTLATLLLRARARVADTIRRRDPLVIAGLVLAGAYLALTLVHPSKAAYFVPTLPLLVLTLSRWVEARGRLILAAALASYAFVYPDVVDRGPNGIHLVFHWNNGLLVKDVVSRVNTQRAFAQIERHRPHRGEVVALGYWLDPWRWGEPQAVRVSEVAGGVHIDARDNAAWRTPDGASMVHSIGPAAAAALRARDIPLAYGEDIDASLREADGVDLRALGAVRVPVRTLGPEVAERFTAPRMIGCLAGRQPWLECLQAAGSMR